MRLLYVEDNERFRSLAIRRFLSEHAVTVAGTLQEAREVLSLATFDAALLDYDLPDGKGTELLPDLDQAGIRERTIAVSSHESGNAALLAAGAAIAVSKMEFERIEEVLAQQSPGL